MRDEDEREEQVLRRRRHTRVQVLLREATVGGPKVARAESEEENVGVISDDEVWLTLLLVFFRVQ